MLCFFRPLSLTQKATLHLSTIISSHIVFVYLCFESELLCLLWDDGTQKKTNNEQILQLCTLKIMKNNEKNLCFS